jgi:sarcosine oxidase
MKPHNQAYDAIVVGLGAMGSATLYQLAKRGLKVLGIDRFSPPHALGSTHGSARVMRQAIGEGAHYTPLSLRSYDLFRQIESETGTRLLDVTGMLVISSVDKSKIASEGEFFENTVTAAEQHGIRHDVLDATEIRKRFPQFNIAPDEKGYFEYDAGYLRPEDCVRAQLMLAQKLGASICTNEVVDDFRDTGHGVEIKTDKQTYFADQVVLAAGPWMPGLLDQEYNRVLSVQRQVQLRFDISDSFSSFKPGACPIFFWQLPGNDRWIYGFPALAGPSAGLLVSAPDRSEPVTPETVVRSVSNEQAAALYDEYIRPHLPAVSRRVIDSSVCLITVTTDAEFIIDRHPKSANVILCSPCSGHGFKHSAALGECLAELVAVGETTLDIGRFKLGRLLSTV